MYDEKASKIFDVMILKGLIPEKGVFEITQEIIDMSYAIGNEIFSLNGKKRKPSDIRFHKRIAWLNFYSLVEERKEIIVDKICEKFKQRGGFLYVISNTSFPNHIKIGITVNMKKRLSVYQTSDPYRNYIVEKYMFVEDAIYHENKLKELMNVDIVSGEWVAVDRKNDIFKYMNEI